jgi:hypothetical protein
MESCGTSILAPFSNLVYGPLGAEHFTIRKPASDALSLRYGPLSTAQCIKVGALFKSW